MKSFALLLFTLALIASAVASPAKHTFAVSNGQFLLDGKPFVIRAGEMHYSRVPRELWRDRLRKMRAMGLNAVSTYMFWNVHEPEPNKFYFKDNDDAAAFVRTAQEEGLWVLLRPGPYACAEWEWGGYPYWLANTAAIQVRTTDPQFLKACKKYINAVGKQLASLQINHGGPILMVQVENEYGSFGSDKVYLGNIRDMLRGAGFDGQLYTVDGPSLLAGGTLPDVLCAVNFGENPQQNFETLEKFRPNSPKMNGEFYPGWFDQWGHDHAMTGMGQKVKDIEYMLENGCSFSLYMVHGGWTTGFMNGANVDGGNYHPQVSSYYDDTCIDDAGRPTAKFNAIRDAIAKHLQPGETMPALPVATPIISIPSIDMTESSGIFENLPLAEQGARPMNFETMKQAYGFALYRTVLDQAVKGNLELRDLQDRALVFGNGIYIGSVDRRLKPTELPVDLPGGAQLDILVENLGRVNYGKEIQDEHKGIAGGVWLGYREIAGWESYSLPMSSLKGIKFHKEIVPGPAYYKGTFNLTSVGDTFLDMRGWKKGVVWVNGHNLGRYWHIGAQQTMYLPGCWLHGGKNEIVVFELGDVPNKTIPTARDMIWETHPDGG